MDEINRSKYLNDIEYFSRRLEENPASELFMPLSVALLKLNKYDDVIYYCGQGLEHFPDNLAAKTVMAQAYMGKGKVEDAKGLLKQVILGNRNNYKANKLMGDIYRSEDEPERALGFYRKAIGIAPDDSKLREEIKELEYLLKKGVEHFSELDLPDKDAELVETMAKELADDVKEELAQDEYKDVELEEKEIAQAFAEIHEKKHEPEDDEGFSIDDFHEDYETELKENLLASVDEAIAEKIIKKDFVRLDSEEGQAPENEKEIGLDDFADEIARAEDEAVMSAIEKAFAAKKSETEKATTSETADDNSEADEVTETDTAEQTTVAETVTETASEEVVEETPASESVDNELEAEQSVPESLVKEETAQSEQEQLPQDTIEESEQNDEPATPEALPEEEVEQLTSAEVTPNEEDKKPLTPHDKIIMAKKLIIDAQVETLENTLACILKKTRKKQREAKDETADHQRTES